MQNEEYGEDFDEDDLPPSKTQIKQEMTALQKLGIELSEMKEEVLETFPLTPELRAALQDYRRINHKNAQKRQRQFIGKLMRREDGEAIQARIDKIQEDGHKKARQLHLVEKWRDRLISEEANALNAFLNQYPHTDRQQLRSLIRTIKKDIQTNKPATQKRKLFRFIQDVLATKE